MRAMGGPSSSPSIKFGSVTSCRAVHDGSHYTLRHCPIRSRDPMNGSLLTREPTTELETRFATCTPVHRP